MKLATLLVLTGALGALPAGAAQENKPQPVTPLEARALYIYNFSTFTRWPAGAFADAGSPIIVGVLGKDPFGKVLDDAFKGRTAHGRKLEIRRSNRERDMKGTHILVIPPGEAGRLKATLRAVRGGNTLVIGEAEGLAAAGGTVNLVRRGTKLKFQINPDALWRARLGMHPRVMELAEIVKDR